MQILHSRRHFLGGASLAAATGLVGARIPLAAEGPPETTMIRLKKQMAICFAPLYVVETFLRAEGFSDVQYVTARPGLADVRMIVEGDLNFDVTFAGTIVHQLDSSLPLTALGGLHVGCYQERKPWSSGRLCSRKSEASQLPGCGQARAVAGGPPERIPGEDQHPRGPLQAPGW